MQKITKGVTYDVMPNLRWINKFLKFYEALQWIAMIDLESYVQFEDRFKLNRQKKLTYEIFL